MDLKLLGIKSLILSLLLHVLIFNNFIFIFPVSSIAPKTNFVFIGPILSAADTQMTHDSMADSRNNALRSRTNFIQTKFTNQPFDNFTMKKPREAGHINFPKQTLKSTFDIPLIDDEQEQQEKLLLDLGIEPRAPVYQPLKFHKND